MAFILLCSSDITFWDTLTTSTISCCISICSAMSSTGSVRFSRLLMFSFSQVSIHHPTSPTAITQPEFRAFQFLLAPTLAFLTQLLAKLVCLLPTTQCPRHISFFFKLSRYSSRDPNNVLDLYWPCSIETSLLPHPGGDGMSILYN